MVPWSLVEGYITRFLEADSLEDFFKFLLKTLMKLNRRISTLNGVEKARLQVFITKFRKEWETLDESLTPPSE